MKILFTVETYYPKRDGVQNVTEYLAEGLVKIGHDVTVITSNREINKTEEIYNGVKIKRVNLYTKYGLYFGEKKKYKKLLYDFSSSVDILINVCTQNAFTDLILNELTKYKCKKILYMHGMFDFKISSLDFTSLASSTNKIWKEFRWFFYYLLSKNNFKKYDEVIQIHNEDYGNLFFKNKYKITSNIIENAVDDSFFYNKKIDFEKPYNKYIIYVANYSDGKNQKLAVKEFLNSKIDDDIGLVLIGSVNNKYYYGLKKYILTEKLKRGLTELEKPIKLLYNVDRNLTIEYVKNANLYLMTSKIEKFPVSLIESMASKIPFITTDVGISKFLPGGFVTNKKLIHKFIELFFANEQLLSKMGELGYEFAKKNYQINDKVLQLDKIIRKRK